MTQTVHDHLIHKHSITADPQRLRMALGAVVLGVQAQGQCIVIWERHKAGEELTSMREFRIIKTGEHFDESDGFLVYRGTAQMPTGIKNAPDEWHVFEVLKAFGTQTLEKMQVKGGKSETENHGDKVRTEGDGRDTGDLLREA